MRNEGSVRQDVFIDESLIVVQEKIKMGTVYATEKKVWSEIFCVM